MSGSINILDRVHPVVGLAATAADSKVSDYISLKYAKSAAVVLTVVGGTGPSAVAISLLQAQAVANTGEKALDFTTYYYKANSAAADAPWVKGTAVNSTFDSAAVANNSNIYVIPVDPASLDTVNSFDCVSVSVGNATNSTVTAWYLIEPNYAGNPALTKSAIVD